MTATAICSAIFDSPSPAATIFCSVSSVAWLSDAPASTSLRISPIEVTASSTTERIPSTVAVMSLVLFAVRSASFLTSSDTTAKPRPCSPALAASIAAFSASRLVCSAMSLMMPVLWPTRSTDSLTLAIVVLALDTAATIFWPADRLWAMFALHCAAMLLASLAASATAPAFWETSVMATAFCSMLALTRVMPSAWPAARSAATLASPSSFAACSFNSSADPCTWPTSSRKRSTVECSNSSIWPNSSCCPLSCMSYSSPFWTRSSADLTVERPRLIRAVVKTASAVTTSNPSSASAAWNCISRAPVSTLAS